MIALLLILAAVAVNAVPESKFTRKIDTHKLAEEWKSSDEENEEWHEDTYDWREKMRKKKAKHVEFDPKNPMKFLQNSGAGGGMQMIFVTLKPGLYKGKQQATELGLRWKQMLQTDGIEASIYTLSESQIIVSAEERIFEVNSFLMQQTEEVFKVRMKDQDQYVGGATPTPAPKPRKIKKKVKRVKKKTHSGEDL